MHKQNVRFALSVPVAVTISSASTMFHMKQFSVSRETYTSIVQHAQKTAGIWASKFVQYVQKYAIVQYAQKVYNQIKFTINNMEVKTMTYEQVYALVNIASQQMWGTQAITTNDLSGLISLGDLVFSSNSNRDGYLGTLVDRIGSTLFRTLDNRVEFPAFIRNEIEFGAITQKVNINVLPAQSSEYTEVGNMGFTPNQFKIDKPQISQLLFGDPRLVWEFDLTIPDTLFKTAFTSEAQMGAFISGIMDAMDKSLVESVNAMNHAALCELIAEKIKAGHNVINLFTEYNSVAAVPVASVDEFRLTDAALRFSSMMFERYIKYLSQTSALYNEGINSNPQLRATQRDNLHVLISSDFAADVRFNLYSNDYNYSFEELPLYDEYVALQGSGTTAHNFDDDTSIDVIPSSEAGAAVPAAVQQSGIVAVFADREAIFTTWRDMFTATDRNNRNRYTNFTSGCGLSYGVDLSENAVVFILDDTTP